MPNPWLLMIWLMLGLFAGGALHRWVEGGDGEQEIKRRALIHARVTWIVYSVAFVWFALNWLAR